MTARKRAKRKSSGGAAGHAKGPQFHAIADGLFELRIGPRLAIDVLITLDGELLTFVRFDGALLGELPVQGQG